MSDYISKSALIEAIVNTQSVNIPRCASVIFRNGYYNGKAERQHEIIDIIDIQPTLDEKEIIRKPFERVVERLEETKMRYFLSIANTGSEIMDFAYENVGDALDEAIKILKEERGISE